MHYLKEKEIFGRNMYEFYDWVFDENWIPCDWDDYLVDEFDP